MAGPVEYGLGRRIDSWLGLLLCALLFVAARLRALLGGPPLPPRRATTPPLPGANGPPPRRVLAIKFYGLGNVAMLLPVLATLRRGLPDAEIDFLTLRENTTLLERAGVVDGTLGVDVNGYGALARSLWRALREIRRRRYDLVLDFEQFIKLSAILAFLSGAPARIGFNTEGQRRGWLHTTRVVYTDSEHMTRIFMRLLRPLGIEPGADPVSLRVEDIEQERIVRLLADHGVDPTQSPIVAVHVGSGANFYKVRLKRWPVAHFARVCDGLVERHGAAIVFTGKGSEEAALVRDARGQMKHAAIDACDQLSLGELLALLRGSRLVLCNDTSVMHLAATLGTPLAVVFGPTNPLHYGPGDPEHLVFYKDLYCSPCLTNYNLKVSYCRNPVCVRSITPEEVLERIHRKWLGTRTPLRPHAIAAGRNLHAAERE